MEKPSVSITLENWLNIKANMHSNIVPNGQRIHDTVEADLP